MAGQTSLACPGMTGSLCNLLCGRSTCSGRWLQVVDAAISESMFNMMEGCIPEYVYSGHDRPPSGSTISGTCLISFGMKLLGGHFRFPIMIDYATCMLCRRYLKNHVMVVVVVRPASSR